MDLTSVLNRSEPHQRTIVHLDMDYYYAQVEEIRDPTLRSRPMGVSQKSSVVTCNYVARAAGVKKMTYIEDAKIQCPELVLINGEDLTPYRQMSQRVHDVLLNYTPIVEKLGFDENYLDVSNLVEQRLREQKEHSHTNNNNSIAVVGHVHPANTPQGLNACSCGCAERLSIGTQIAAEIRQELHLRLRLTCCAGISYNKLLAKLVGSQHKPNQQTVLVSTYAEQFMRDLDGLNRVTGIGHKTQQLLIENNISTVGQLQACDMDTLRKKCGFETAKKLKDLSFGRDTGAVRSSGKPKTIGLEDACRPISVRSDVEESFRILLLRLLELVGEDGRIPIAIKVVLRKFDAQKKSSHRETKQANILPSLFRSDAKSGKVMLAEGAQEKLLKIVMRLFERVVNMEKPFNITLIGLAFNKFQQRKAGSASIANFLIKKTDLEVQSITSLTNNSTNNVSLVSASNSPTPSVSSNNSGDEAAFRSSPTTFQPSDQFYRRRAATASPIPMLLDNGSESGATNSDFSDFSETEVEPSPKKSRISRLLMSKRRCLGHSTNPNTTCTSLAASDVASPSKLRVCDLNLSSRDSDNATTSPPMTANAHYNIQSQRFMTVQPTTTTTAATSSTSLLSRMDCVDKCRRPSMLSATSQRPMSCNSSANSSPIASPLPSPMDESFTTLPTTATVEKKSTTPTESALKITTITSNKMCVSSDGKHVPYPANVDPQVFKELPMDVQNELIASWRNSPAVVKSATGSVASSASSSGVNGSQKNTLYRYFLRNK